MSSRVLLLSARETDLRPDTDLRVVVRDLLVALGAHPGSDVIHHEVARMADVERAVRTFRPDAVFNACETLYGESSNEPVVPLLLERLGVAFTGSPAACLRQCLRKADATAALRAAGVPVPATLRIAAAVDPGDLADRLRFPLIVKPEREDGSVGIHASSVVHNAESLHRAVVDIVDGLEQPAVVQEYIEGREIAVSLLGWPEPRVLPPGEIAFDAELFAGRARVLTYESKWDEESPDFRGTRSIAAATSPATLSRVAAVARRAFLALGMRDYGRVDLRLDADGRPFVIDVNPNCDLSTEGGFAKAVGRAGLRYDDAVFAILRGALARASRGVSLASTPPLA
jgi:D-alanine-D-alanine ligase